MAHFECGFPFVPFAYANIIVALAYVKFAEQLHSLEVFYILGKIKKGGDVFSGYCIEWLVVDDLSLFFAVLLWDHKCAKSIW